MLKNRIIPCLDVKNGRVVKGINFVELKDAGDPVEQAKIYSDGGADEICFLDITASNENRETIIDIVRKTAKECFVPLTVGGGVRTIQNITDLLLAGADKVSINTAAVKDVSFIKEACSKFKNKIALGLDAKEGKLSVSGWKENLNIKTIDFLKEVNDFGVSRLIYTDINRDGMKNSPNFEETINIAEISNCPVVISGGVSSISDVKKAKELNNEKIEGIIVGKAIYDGDIKLEELVKEIDA